MTIPTQTTIQRQVVQVRWQSPRKQRYSARWYRWDDNPHANNDTAPGGTGEMTIPTQTTIQRQAVQVRWQSPRKQQYSARRYRWDDNPHANNDTAPGGTGVVALKKKKKGGFCAIYCGGRGRGSPGGRGGEGRGYLETVNNRRRSPQPSGILANSWITNKTASEKSWLPPITSPTLKMIGELATHAALAVSVNVWCWVLAAPGQHTSSHGVTRTHTCQWWACATVPF